MNEGETKMQRRTAPNQPRRRPMSGQSLLEVALLSPLLFLLLIGVIEIGRYAYFAIGVGNAAHAAAAYAAQNTVTAGNTTGITAAACYDFNETSSNCGLSVTTTYTCQCDNNGSMTADASCAACGATEVLAPYVQVTASGNFTPIFNFPFIPSQFTVSRTATMRIN